MKRVLLFALISAAVHSGIKAQTTPSEDVMWDYLKELGYE
jgi:hypothetical protein